MHFQGAPRRRFLVPTVVVAICSLTSVAAAADAAMVPVSAFCGTYQLVDPPRQSRRVRRAVDRVVDDISFLIRGIVRGRAHAKIFPEPRVAVRSFDQGGFVLNLGRHHTLSCLPDGVLRKERHGEVRCWRDDRHLVQQYVGPDATSTITVWLDPGGSMLHASISVVNHWFPRPIVFELLYRRED